MAVTWIVYCEDCRKEIESCKNGAWADAAGTRHMRDYPDHYVLVGYRVVVKNEALTLAEGMAKDLDEE